MPFIHNYQDFLSLLITYFLKDLIVKKTKDGKMTESIYCEHSELLFLLLILIDLEYMKLKSTY